MKDIITITLTRDVRPSDAPVTPQDVADLKEFIELNLAPPNTMVFVSYKQE